MSEDAQKRKMPTARVSMQKAASMRFIYNRFFIVFKWAAKIIIPTDIRSHRNKKSPRMGA
jgi:hypothetical protein